VRMARDGLRLHVDGGWAEDGDPHSLPRVILPGLPTARLRPFFANFIEKLANSSFFVP